MWLWLSALFCWLSFVSFPFYFHGTFSSYPKNQINKYLGLNLCLQWGGPCLCPGWGPHHAPLVIMVISEYALGPQILFLHCIEMWFYGKLCLAQVVAFMGWFEPNPSLLFLFIGPNIQAQLCSSAKKSDNTQTLLQNYYMGQKTQSKSSPMWADHKSELIIHCISFDLEFLPSLYIISQLSRPLLIK